jgi:large subunit ribosomal protein L35Ae
MSEIEILKGKKGIIMSYRRGRHTQRNKQMLIKCFEYDSDKIASKLIGKRVIWETKTGKYIKGKITRTHGKKGVLRARFEKGLPGDAVGTTVRIK